MVGTLGAAPCAVVACSLRRGGRWLRGVGAAGRLGAAEGEASASPGTIFDLASVTKPFTALAAARLHVQGRLDLEAPLSAIDDRFAGTAAGTRSLALLLRHRAGLDAHLRLFAPLEQGLPFEAERALATAAEAMRPGCDGPAPVTGFEAVYSDLGYLLAGFALERLEHAPLDALVEREVAAPTGARVGSARRLRAARTAFDGEVAPTEDVAYRGGVVRGLVHDDNAFAFRADASCGHAGLFGTAADVLAFGEAVLEARNAEREAWLPRALLEGLLAPWPGGSHVFGFDTKSGPTPSCGSRFGAATFGHLGFTGTSLWMDPEAGLIGVLLTNRVHPSREHVAIRKARPLVYDAIAEAAAAEDPEAPRSER